MDALDTYIPMPARPADLPFLMPVEDVFGIKGRGTVVTGRIERGIVKVGDEIEIVGITRDAQDASSPASRCSRSCSTRARRATTSAASSAALSATTSSAARCWPSPASITPHTDFEAEVYVLSRTRAAVTRRSSPATARSSTSAPRTSPAPSSCRQGVEMVMPGDNIKMTVELIQPVAWRKAFASPSAKAAARSAQAL